MLTTGVDSTLLDAYDKVLEPEAPNEAARMRESYQSPGPLTWLWRIPSVRWLAEYRRAWLASDAIAGVTLAAYAIPVSLAYAALAGLPPQVGVYGYLLGGAGYALFGSSRHSAIGPTSAISLMIAGTVGAMAGGDAQRYAEIASLAGFTVAGLCLIAWAFRLSVLVKLISDSILVGFKAGAGLTIAMTQLPSLFGVPGGGHNFFERAVLLVGHLGQTQPIVLAVGVISIILLTIGGRLLPGKPVALGVVRDVEGIFPPGRRMSAARLYRKHLRGPHVRCQARISCRPEARISRDRGSQSRGGRNAGASSVGKPAGMAPVVATPRAGSPNTDAASGCFTRFFRFVSLSEHKFEVLERSLMTERPWKNATMSALRRASHSIFERENDVASRFR